MNNKTVYRVILLIDQLGQGGAERQLSYLACQLVKMGCEVRLISFHDSETHYMSELNKEGIKIELHSEGRSKLKRPLFLCKVIKRWKPDMVVAYKEGNSMAACISRMFTKFNLVVSERNTTQKFTFRERLKFNLYRFADTIVSNSHSQFNVIIGKYPNLKSKLKVIENMLDFDKFKPREDILDNQIPQIITVGRLSPQKNVLNYLKAIKIFKDNGLKVHFNWYGRPEYPEYFKAIKHLMKELEIEDYITFYGGSDNITAAYHENDIFVLPSQYEGFPNVLCEAIASGLPSLASNVNDIPYILKDPKFLFDPNNPIDIADKIESFLKLNKDNLIEIRDRNLKRVYELCSPEKFAKKYIELAICR